MIDRLQQKQRKLIKLAKEIKYKRREFEFVNSGERLIALVGARGVGKTTLLLQYLSQYSLNEALYISADDISITSFGIIGIVEEFYALGGRVVAVDEVHMFKDWAGHIKNLYDFYPDLTIRISGSSMLNILMQSHDLSRRVVKKELKELNFKEYLEIKYDISLPDLTLEDILSKHNDISFELTEKYPYLYREFQNYLKVGAYPYYTNSSSYEIYQSKLLNSIEKIIYEDIPSTNKIKFENLSVFKKLIYQVVASQKPYKVSIDKLSKELNISEPTLYTYLDILDTTGIFKTLKKYSKKISRKPQKIFFKNTNILYAVSIDLGLVVDVGTTRETFFINCFKRIFYSAIGDFRVGDIIYEVGGKNKTFNQIKDIANSYLAVDTDTTAHKNKIPLWLFGFLYN